LRSPSTGGAWQDQGTASEQNLWGTDCLETYSWCSEQFSGEDKLSVRPGRTDNCEAATNNSNGSTDVCSDGTWVLTIRIGETRLAACGF
jgi:hypothetical protein